MASECQQYPGMRLLLLMEHTVRGEVFKKQSAHSHFLDGLTTEDGSVSFQPVLHVGPVYDVPVNKKGQKSPTSHDKDSVSLTLMSYVSRRPSMVHCKVTGWRENKTTPPLDSSYSESDTDSSEDDDNSRRRNGTPGTPNTEEPAPLTLETRNVLTNALMHRLPLSLPLTDSFKKVTVVIMVFNIANVHPLRGVRLCFGQARLADNLCDMKLAVDGAELPAHRLVLALRSPVFNKMLTGDFREARECRVEVVDFSKGAIEKFLEFLYTDHVQDWGGCEMELLQLADKYMVPELREECSLRLWTCDAPRALEVLHAAGLCELISRPLRRRLTAVVVFNMDSLEDTKEWAEFQATYPVLADSMLGSSDSSRKSDSTTSVWALQ